VQVHPWGGFAGLQPIFAREQGRRQVRRAWGAKFMTFCAR
jgi:hypothetical protein